MNFKFLLFLNDTWTFS